MEPTAEGRKVFETKESIAMTVCVTDREYVKVKVCVTVAPNGNESEKVPDCVNVFECVKVLD